MSESRHPLVPLLDQSDDPLGQELLHSLRSPSGTLLNLHRAMGHAPLVLKASSDMAKVLREATLLPRDLTELAILRTAQILKSDYVWVRHRAMALRAGLTPEKIERISLFRTDGIFSGVEKAVLDFTEATVAGEKPGVEFEPVLRNSLSPRAIVELAMVVCSYVSTARFISVLQLPEEEPR